MKRTQLNFVIDAAAFAAFLTLLSTGLLLRYQLPAGSGGLHATGTGRGAAERPISLLWGWTRHDWGAVHYWIAGVLVAILAAHVMLHWKWIVCVVRGAKSDASGLRFGIGLASLAALVLIAAAPLLAPVAQITRGELQQSRTVPDAVDRSSEIHGSMTLAEAAATERMTVAELIAVIGLPADVSSDERIGRLLRRHGMQMSDLRRKLGADDYIARKETEP
jgi:hypothetical protein